jgi:CheY-like chemotaxis protein
MSENLHIDGEGSATPPAVPDVLVVDDNADVRLIVSEMLSDLGYLVSTAPDGAEALRLLLGGMKPHLILLDRNTPALDGPAFLAAAAGKLDGIAVVWMSGAEENAAEPDELATLRKPFAAEELKQIVQAHAGRR